jgi:hypothetical protein
MQMYGNEQTLTYKVWTPFGLRIGTFSRQFLTYSLHPNYKEVFYGTQYHPTVVRWYYRFTLPNSSEY